MTDVARRASPGASHGFERLTMKALTLWYYRATATSLAILLAAPLSVASAQEAPAATARQENPAPARPATQKTASALVASLPDSPNPQAQPAAYPQQQQTAPQTAPPPPSAPQGPIGTAAAPEQPPGGVAASRPAGAAIAPAKQRRTRTIVIRVGLVVGAAVAIGTIAALSKASPSRP
jgi:hypothetical protein